MPFLSLQKVEERADQVVKDRMIVWQWIVVSVSGVLLGLYALTVFSLPPQWLFLFVFGTSIAILAITIGKLKRIFLALVVLDIAIQFDINLFYDYEIAEMGAYGGLSISITTICLAGLYAAWLVELLTRKVTLPSYLFRMSLPGAAYLGTAIFSLVVARNISLALWEVALLTQMFFVYIYIVGTVKTREDVLFVVVLLVSILTIESLIMLAVRFKGQSFQILGLLARIESGMRAGGTVGSPNEAAGFLTMLLMCALGTLSYRRRGFSFWIVAFAFLLGSIALIFTYSRGGWISFVFAVTVFCILSWYRGRLSTFILIPIAFVILLTLFPFQDLILERLFGYDKGSAYVRIPLMELAFRVIWENPLLGVGANNFVVTIKRYSTTPWLYVVHNKYLLIWSETGIVGLTAFFWFLFAAIRRGWLCTQFNDPVITPLCCGLIAGISGIMVHMLVDLFHGRSVVQLIWLTTGLIAAMHCIVASQDTPKMSK
jgi:O-antigen ligase